MQAAHPSAAIPCKASTEVAQQNGVIDISSSPLPATPAHRATAAPGAGRVQGAADACAGREAAPSAALTAAHLQPPPRAAVKSLAAVLMRPKQPPKPRAPIAGALPPVHVAAPAPPHTQAAPQAELDAMRSLRAAVIERSRAAWSAPVASASLGAQLAAGEAHGAAHAQLRDAVERCRLPEGAERIAAADDGRQDATMFTNSQPHAAAGPQDTESAPQAASGQPAGASVGDARASAAKSVGDGQAWVQRHAPQSAAGVCGNGDVAARIAAWLQGFCGHGGGGEGTRCVRRGRCYPQVLSACNATVCNDRGSRACAGQRTRQTAKAAAAGAVLGLGTLTTLTSTTLTWRPRVAPAGRAVCC